MSDHPDDAAPIRAVHRWRDTAGGQSIWTEWTPCIDRGFRHNSTYEWEHSLAPASPQADAQEEARFHVTDTRFTAKVDQIDQRLAAVEKHAESQDSAFAEQLDVLEARVVALESRADGAKLVIDAHNEAILKLQRPAPSQERTGERITLHRYYVREADNYTQWEVCYKIACDKYEHRTAYLAPAENEQGKEPSNLPPGIVSALKLKLDGQDSAKLGPPYDAPPDRPKEAERCAIHTFVKRSECGCAKQPTPPPAPQKTPPAAAGVEAKDPYCEPPYNENSCSQCRAASERSETGKSEEPRNRAHVCDTPGPENEFLHGSICDCGCPSCSNARQQPEARTPRRRIKLHVWEDGTGHFVPDWCGSACRFEPVVEYVPAAQADADRDALERVRALKPMHIAVEGNPGERQVAIACICVRDLERALADATNRGEGEK